MVVKSQKEPLFLFTLQIRFYTSNYISKFPQTSGMHDLERQTNYGHHCYESPRTVPWSYYPWEKTWGKLLGWSEGLEAKEANIQYCVWAYLTSPVCYV